MEIGRGSLFSSIALKLKAHTSRQAIALAKDSTLFCSSGAFNIGRQQHTDTSLNIAKIEKGMKPRTHLLG